MGFLRASFETHLAWVCTVCLDLHYTVGATFKQWHGLSEVLTAHTHHSHHAYALCQHLTFASGVQSTLDKSITFYRSLGPKSITALAHDHVWWYAVDRPRMRRDERRLRVRVMTLQTTDLQLLLARKRFPEYTQVVAVRPRPMDGTDADPARLHGVLSCTFSVSRSLLSSQSLLGWSTYRE